MVCILAVSIIFTFSACKNDDIKQEQSSTTTSTTEKENTTEAELSEPDKTTETLGDSLFGTWIYDEIISPQAFYADFYSSEITKSNIEMKTTYKFNNDGTFSIGVSIANMSDVRKEYRRLMVAAGRTNIESQGKVLTTDDVLYYEEYADKILAEICKEQKGTYEVNGNKLVYTLNGETYYETFKLNGDKLTLTGSSVSDNGSPMTMTKI